MQDVNPFVFLAGPRKVHALKITRYTVLDIATVLY